MLEQAEAHVVVAPVGLIAKIDRRFVGAGDPISIELLPEPFDKSLTLAAFVGGSAKLRNAVCSTPICTAAHVDSSGPIVLSAYVNGILKKTFVRVDVVACATGDSLLDNPAIRKMLDTMYKRGVVDTMEYMGMGVRVPQRQDSSFSDTFVVDWNNPGNTCVTSGFNMSAFPLSTGQGWITRGHVHPYRIGDKVQCAGVNGKTSVGPQGGVPSDRDWDGTTGDGYPQVVMDADSILRYGGGTLSNRAGGKGAPPGGFKIPNASEIQNKNTYNSFARSTGSCARP